MEFLYEPVAAGFEFEARLSEDAVVLVVDIGGGTTDCSVLRMGPSHRDRLDRSGDLLGHSGQRIGGNDFDIRLTVEGMMPLLGMHETLKTGAAAPPCSGTRPPSTTSAPRAASTAWRRAASCRISSSTASPAASCPSLASLRAHKLSHQLVWRAEQGKIALSDHERNHQTLNELEKGWRPSWDATSWHPPPHRCWRR